MTNNRVSSVVCISMSRWSSSLTSETMTLALISLNNTYRMCTYTYTFIDISVSWALRLGSQLFHVLTGMNISHLPHLHVYIANCTLCILLRSSSLTILFSVMSSWVRNTVHSIFLDIGVGLLFSGCKSIVHESCTVLWRLLDELLHIVHSLLLSPTTLAQVIWHKRGRLILKGARRVSVLEISHPYEGCF